MRFAPLIVAALITAMPVQAQRGQAARTCVLVWPGPGGPLPPGSYTTSARTVSGKYTWWFGGGFRAHCRGTDMFVSADSAEYSEDAQVMTLVGRARYTEAGNVITADLMRYYERTSTIVAEGNVDARTREGTTLSAQLATYLRPQPGLRNFSQADASIRTRLVIRDSVQVPDSLATVITADRLHMRQDSLFYAAGTVVITRSDIIGTSDSVETNSNSSTARLLGGKPRLQGRGNRRFTIDGRVLDVYGPQRRLERLIARGNAVAVSDSMTLTADTLDLRTSGDLIERVDAWGPGRARAVSPEQDIVANRIELSMPGQKLNDLHAYGLARAETKPDSTVRSDERNWIEGDTLIARFDQNAPRPTPNSQPPMRELISRGSARTFYQAASRDRTCAQPALNYVSGRHITVALDSGRVGEVRVVGEVRGVNLAPCSAPTDSVPRRRGGGR